MQWAAHPQRPCHEDVPGGTRRQGQWGGKGHPHRAGPLLQRTGPRSQTRIRTRGIPANCLRLQEIRWTAMECNALRATAQDQRRGRGHDRPQPLRRRGGALPEYLRRKLLQPVACGTLRKLPGKPRQPHTGEFRRRADHLRARQGRGTIRKVRLRGIRP